jgi:uncharacterized membrane protein
LVDAASTSVESVMAWHLTLSEDLPSWLTVSAVVLALTYFVVTMIETLRTSAPSDSGHEVGRARALILISGGVAVLLFFLALARPAIVRANSSFLGAKVVVLLDGARRLGLPAGDRSRRELAVRAHRELLRHYSGMRVSTFEFGDGKLRTYSPDGRSGTPAAEYSDLGSALAELSHSQDEKPSLLVVVSDGRWPDLQGVASDSDGLRSEFRGTPVHVVDVGGRTPRDASVYSVSMVGTAVAHQPLSVDVDVLCTKVLGCGDVPVVIREHKRGSGPVELARGDALFSGQETARVRLEITVERAGTRIIEVAITPPAGDEIRANDKRLLPLDVIRDRLRLLHVAGRPTYDVRALRTWLKSDASVDLVSFFILRTDSDETNADEDNELALIPFPVNELFSEHLPSFDAVILEDIDAERYHLSTHFENLARYVEQGGGLLLVGGPSAFSGGAYASSPLERVLPVALMHSEHPFDTVEFVPRVTTAGLSSRLLDPLRSVLGDHLPSMPGANTLGPARPKAVVLWEHPSRTAVPIKTGGLSGPMPVLSVSEVGDGRVVAMGVDGTHRLAWGDEGTKTAGRAYGALWDGLLGWVMRDRRFEAAQGELLGPCIAGLPAQARFTYSSAVDGPVLLEIQRLDATERVVLKDKREVHGEKTTTFELGRLEEGAYSALARVGGGPAARFDFACEGGGAAWRDSRPDPDRLGRLATTMNGSVVSAEDVGKLPLPERTEVTSYRQISPVLPPWVWALLATAALSAHWVMRRHAGLS